MEIKNMLFADIKKRGISMIMIMARAKRAVRKRQGGSIA